MLAREITQIHEGLVKVSNTDIQKTAETVGPSAACRECFLANSIGIVQTIVDMVANMVVLKAGVMGVAMGECFLHIVLESFWSPTMIAMQDSFTTYSVQ